MEDFADKAADGTKRASQLQVLGKGLQSAFRVIYFEGSHFDLANL